MNKERVTYTDEEFEGLEEKGLLAYINYLQQKREDHKAAAEKLPRRGCGATSASTGRHRCVDHVGPDRVRRSGVCQWVRLCRRIVALVDSPTDGRRL